MSRSVTVAVDAFALSDGSEFRGIGTYLTGLLDGLGRAAGIEVTVVGCRRRLDLPGVAERSLPAWVPQRARPAAWSARQPSEIARTYAEVFHSPAQQPPRRSPVPWVQTLHDLTPLVFDHPLLAADKARWQRIGPRLRQAAAVICISASAADQGITLLGLDPARIHVVPHAVGAQFTPGGEPAAEASPFLLWLSSWGPHKGLAEALSVLELLVDAGHPHRLVIGGRQDSWMLSQIRRQVEASPARERVSVLGWVPDLPALYRSATALLMTSRAEGFGLPALEAMACGLPVVAFDNTSLPEVVGEAGILVPDGDVQVMWRAVEQLVTSPSLANELRVAGPLTASRRTASQVLEEHLEVYRLAADSPRPEA